jgi:hypothetical protein
MRLLETLEEEGDKELIALLTLLIVFACYDVTML